MVTITIFFTSKKQLPFSPFHAMLETVTSRGETGDSPVGSSGRHGRMRPMSATASLPQISSAKRQKRLKKDPTPIQHSRRGCCGLRRPPPQPGGTDLTADRPSAPDPLSVPAYKIPPPSRSQSQPQAHSHGSRLLPVHPSLPPQPRRDPVVDAAARPLLQPPLPELLPRPPRHRGILISRASSP